MILLQVNKVEKIKYFSTLLGLIFIEITRGPLQPMSKPLTQTGPISKPISNKRGAIGKPERLKKRPICAAHPCTVRTPAPFH